MAVSIKDIARLAGVSHSTVSRALRHSPLIPPTTRERIERIAEEHGYSVSAIARSLVTRKTHAIGVVVTSLSDPFNGDVVSGIEEVANHAGYSVVLSTSQADGDRELSVVRALSERRVDGVVIASSRVGALYAKILGDLQIPIVLLNNQHPGNFAHSVTIDNVDGAQKATEHLADLGHKRIAFIGDSHGMQSDKDRRRGFTAVLRKRNILLCPAYVVQGDGKPALAGGAVSRLLELRDPPTAIFCYNDMTALGVLDAASKMRIKVPQDLSVCGFDDLFFAPFLNPPLTSIRQPKKEIGERAARLLLLILAQETANKTIKIKGSLVIRGSTAPPGG